MIVLISQVVEYEVDYRRTNDMGKDVVLVIDMASDG